MVMILSDDEVAKRLNSPMNLMNKLKTLSSSKSNAMDLFIRPKEVMPSGPTVLSTIGLSVKVGEPHPTENTQLVSDQPATLDSLIQNHESQIQLGLAHNSSIDLLNRSIGLLAAKLDDVKADRLPSVISTASKVIESIRQERAEASKNNRDREVHYHFYTPQQKKIEDFEVIEVQ